jgi:hypothetical protein
MSNIPFREFTPEDTIADQIDHAKAVRARIFNARPKPKPVAPLPVAVVSARPEPEPEPIAPSPDPTIPTFDPAFIEAIVDAIEARRKRKQGMGSPILASERGVSVTDLLAIVWSATGIRESEIRSDRRHTPTVKARQITMWLAKRFTPFSMPGIGHRIGGRDHTTVLHACNKIDRIVAVLGAPAEDTPYVWAAHLWAADWRLCLNPRADEGRAS